MRCPPFQKVTLAAAAADSPPRRDWTWVRMGGMGKFPPLSLSRPKRRWRRILFFILHAHHACLILGPGTPRRNDISECKERLSPLPPQPPRRSRDYFNQRVSPPLFLSLSANARNFTFGPGGGDGGRKCMGNPRRPIVPYLGTHAAVILVPLLHTTYYYLLPRTMYLPYLHK